MRKTLLFFIALSTCSYVGFCQVPVNSKIYFAKEFSKEITLYRAKSFLIDEVLGSSQTVVKYSIDPLAATKSGELTPFPINARIKSWKD